MLSPISWIRIDLWPIKTTPGSGYEGGTTMTVNVALVDDHLVFREAFRALLAATSEFSVVAEATEGREVVALFEASKPDVVVIDVTLPGTDGLSGEGELPPDIRALRS